MFQQLCVIIRARLALEYILKTWRLISVTSSLMLFILTTSEKILDTHIRALVKRQMHQNQYAYRVGISNAFKSGLRKCLQEQRSTFKSFLRYWGRSRQYVLRINLPSVKAKQAAERYTECLEDIYTTMWETIETQVDIFNERTIV